MGELGIHAHLSIQKPNTILGKIAAAFQGKLSGNKPVVHLIAKSGESVVFDQIIGSGTIATSKEDFERKLSDSSFLPIPLKEIKNKLDAGQLNTTEVIFVRVDDLVKMNFHISLDKLRINDRKDTGTDLKLLQVSNKIVSAISNMVFFQTIKETVVTKWSQPVEQETLQKAEAFLAEHSKVQLTKEQSNKLVSARTGGSNTIQSDPKKTQDWLNADQFIRQKVESTDNLTLEDLCQLNALLNGADNEEIDGGKLRDHIVQVGGQGGATYVHHDDVPSLLKEVLEDINKGVTNGENPVILAAKAFQRMVSIHPFSDGNGRTCRLVMDYVLLKAGLPPPSLGNNVNFAIFGDQPLKPGLEPPLSNPTHAVQRIIEGLQNSYNLII